MHKLDLQGAKQVLARLGAPFFIETWGAAELAGPPSEPPTTTTGEVGGAAAISFALAIAAWATSLALIRASREEGEPTLWSRDIPTSVRTFVK